VLLKVSSKGPALLPEVLYVKLSFGSDLLHSWEVYSSRKSDEYWTSNYGVSEPPIISVSQSLFFPLEERFGDVKYYLIHVKDDGVCTEPIGDDLREEGKINGMVFVIEQLALIAPDTPQNDNNNTKGENNDEL
jgi:hypothetical protein